VAVTELQPGVSRVLDVRRPIEWDRFHVRGATSIPLAQLPQRLDELDRTLEWNVTCGSGYRSMIAASLLQRAGFSRVRSIDGGMEAWRHAGLPVEEGAPA
jgi:hydroxyacylglutathione hydrolase